MGDRTDAPADRYPVEAEGIRDALSYLHTGEVNDCPGCEAQAALDRLVARLVAVEDALRPFIENARVITDEWAKRTYGDGYIFSRAALDEDGTQRVWGFSIEDIETLAAAADTNQAESA